MVTVVLVLLVLAAVALPGLWVKRVLAKYSEPADRYGHRGSGAELARHLLDRFELQQVAVEETETGYLLEDDLPHAQRILKAAAMTYVAASLMSLLNLGRWLAVLRRLITT